MDIKIDLPQDVRFILNTLQQYGTGLLVGGSVRDLLMGEYPKDYDFATNIEYEKLKEIFKDYSPKEIGKSFGILQINVNDTSYEIAKFRKDSSYTDNRHPDQVEFIDNFMEDALRRDFTINAMGYDGVRVFDYFNGIKDLDNKIIRFVGNADERIKEDALRMLRLVRFCSTRNLEPSYGSVSAIIKNAKLITNISKERVKMELDKILLSDNPSYGIEMLHSLGLLQYIIPELDDCYGFNQNNSHHDKDLFNHLMCVLDNTNPDLVTRLSALLHDIGKPLCHTQDENGESHYYQHHKISADMAREILQRLKYDNNTIDTVCNLVYNHMGKSDKQTDKAIKKFIVRVGENNLDRIFDLMWADIAGHKPPHNFDNLNILKQKCEEILSQETPIHKTQLAINGNDIMSLGFKEGKIIGVILDYCLEKVLENPVINNKTQLIKLIKFKMGVG